MGEVEKWARRVFGWTLSAGFLTILLYIWLVIGFGFDLLPENSSDFVRMMLWALLPGVPAVLVALVASALVAGWVKSVRTATFPERKVGGFRYFLLGTALVLLSMVGHIIAFCLLIVPARRRGRGVLALLIAEIGLAAAIVALRLIAQFGADAAAKLILSMSGLVTGAVYLVGFLVLVPLVSGVKLPRWQMGWAWGTAALAVLAVGLGQYAMFAADAKVELLENNLHNRYGLARTMTELKDVYYRSGAADAAFTALIDDVKARESESQATGESWIANIDFVMNFDRSMLRPDAAERLEFERALAAEAGLCESMDAVVGADTGKYAVDFAVESPADIILPHLAALRSLEKLYAARIRAALVNKDRGEAMRLYRLSGMLLRSQFETEGCLLETLVAYALSSIRLESVADMLASGVLTADDIAAIEVDLTLFCPLFQASLKSGYIGEAGRGGIISDWIISQKGFAGLDISLRNIITAPLYCYFRNDQAGVLRHYGVMLARWTGGGLSVAEVEKLDAERDDELKSHTRILSSMMFVQLKRVFNMAVRSEYMTDMALIGCEIERFRMKNGRLPESLDELAMKDMPRDPYNGEPFVYKTGKFKVASHGEHYEREVEFTGYRLVSSGYLEFEPDETRSSFTVPDPDSAVVVSEERFDDEWETGE